MKIDIIIDKLTPCLVEVSTGQIVQTSFELTMKDEITDLASKGWLFDWTHKELRRANIYKLLVDGEDLIQGLIAAEVVRGAVYVHLAESAPHNLHKEKKYEGVGGHLFAIAIKLSLANGFGGYIYFDAKNIDLVNHYAEMLGAIIVPSRIHDYRMEVLEEKSKWIVEKYTLEGDLNVN